MTYLQFQESPIHPLRVVRHPVDVRESLDAHLDLARVVEDAAAAIEVVLDGLEGVVRRGVLEDGVVPELEVGLVGDEAGERIPLVRRRDETGAVGADGGRLRVCGLEGVRWPGEGGVARRVERGRRVRGGVGLYGCRSRAYGSGAPHCGLGSGRTHRRRV